MFHIYHDLYIEASSEDVFHAVSDPKALEKWWPLECSGKPELLSEYRLYFEPDYDWRAKVIKVVTNVSFHMKMTQSDPDWQPTSFGFDLKEEGDGVWVEFWHRNWPEWNHHYRRSSYCWAILLNGMKDFVEKGIVTPFEERI